MMSREIIFVLFDLEFFMISNYSFVGHELLYLRRGLMCVGYFI